MASAEPVRWEGRVRRNFSTVGGGQVGGRRRSSGRSGGLRSSGAGWECARRTAIAARAEPSRCQVGPTILFDRARAGSPRPLFYPISIWARHSVEASAEPRCDGRGGCDGIFQRSAVGRSGDVEEAAGEAVAFERAGAGWECVRRTAIATRGEQSRCQVGPTILFDRPRAGSPVPSSIKFPPWGGCW